MCNKNVIKYEIDADNKFLTDCPHNKKHKRKIIKVASELCEECTEFVTENCDDSNITCSEVYYTPAMLTNIPNSH